MVNTNEAKIIGKLISCREVWKSNEHTSYEGIVEVNRSSGSIDSIPILFNDMVIDVGKYISVLGQFRSRDVIDETNGKLKVQLYVYTQDIYTINNMDGFNSIVCDTNNNDVVMSGYICKRPTIRTTPSGKQVTDLLVACNFGKDKTAYVPCVAWGKQARQCGKYSIGTLVNMKGRIQSRKYTKMMDNGSIEDKVAYELSLSSIEQQLD